jgi:hypothetical protein
VLTNRSIQEDGTIATGNLGTLSPGLLFGITGFESTGNVGTAATVSIEVAIIGVESVGLVGIIIGFGWSVVPDSAESWSAQSDNNETWTTIADSSESWTPIL